MRAVLLELLVPAIGVDVAVDGRGDAELFEEIVEAAARGAGYAYDADLGGFSDVDVAAGVDEDALRVGDGGEGCKAAVTGRGGYAGASDGLDVAGAGSPEAGLRTSRMRLSPESAM